MQTELEGSSCERPFLNHARLGLAHHSLIPVFVFLEEELRDHETEDGVPEKLQTLIRFADGIFSRRSVGGGQSEQVFAA